MPPRIDPYANKTHRRIDIALIVVTLALIFVVFRLSAQDKPHTTASQTQRHLQSNQ